MSAIMLIVFSNSIHSQFPDKKSLSDNMKSSLILNIETINLLDSVAGKVWNGWDKKIKYTYFVGAPNNSAIFINPTFDLPYEFLFYENMFKGNDVFIREYSNMTKIYFGTIVKIDKNYYRVISMMPFKYDTTDYYINRVSKYINKKSEQRIRNLLFSPEYYISEIIHESFHFYQKNKQKPLLYKTVNPRYYKKPKVAAYSYIEGKLLQMAVYCKDKNEFLNLVRQFISTREKKSILLSKRQQCYEKYDEFLEGTAQYIQTETMIYLNKIAYKSSISDLNKSVHCTFKNAKDFIFLDSLNLVETIIDLKYPGHKHYFYGQAQAKILDKLCSSKWKREIMNDNTFFIELIKKYSDYKKNNSEKYLRMAKKKYNYNNLLKQIRKKRFSKKHYISNVSNQINYNMMNKNI